MKEVGDQWREEECGLYDNVVAESLGTSIFIVLQGS